MFFKFDEYSRKARIAPVLLTFMPLCFISVYLPTLSGFVAAIPIVFVASMGIAAEQVCRFFGKRKEQALVARWGGFPTVRALRFTAAGTDPLLKMRRRDVERLSGMSLPSRREQARDPQQADARYDAAVRRCLPKIDRSKHPLCFAEIVHYGFRRNLLALKPAGLVTLAATIILIAVLGFNSGELSSPVTLVIAAVLLAALLAWLSVVREPWVLAQADSFSERFFISIAP